MPRGGRDRTLNCGDGEHVYIIEVKLSCHGTRLLFALLKRKIALLQCMALQNRPVNERGEPRHLRALGPTTLSASWIA
jgi:hypothetical protein